MTELDLLAEEVGASGRTLRRAAIRGTIRCARPSRNRFALGAAERRWVRRHWGFVREVLAVLRTRRDVRLAALFGSVARGEEGEGSDVDLLVAFDGDAGLRSAELGLRLGETLRRPVQVVTLDQAEAAPLLLADALRDGRVLLDRDGLWDGLRRRERAILRQARVAADSVERDAWTALEGG